MRMTDIAAIVTGGASGLGEATAAMLAEAGARVTIFDLNADIGAATAASTSPTIKAWRMRWPRWNRCTASRACWSIAQASRRR
jgi:NAD(P)-dependent dehydrogenase (short-subunit alcohol dehydrogenase family)